MFGNYLISLFSAVCKEAVWGLPVFLALEVAYYRRDPYESERSKSGTFNARPLTEKKAYIKGDAVFLLLSSTCLLLVIFFSVERNWDIIRQTRDLVFSILKWSEKLLHQTILFTEFHNLFLVI